MDATLSLPSVLVVDDEAPIRQILREVFETIPCNVVEAIDGGTALAALTEHPICLVVSDVNMPGVNGLDLLSETRNHHPGVGVIMMTGKPSVDAAVDCLKIGAIDYISKPLDIMKLRSTVSSIVKSGDGQTSNGRKVSLSVDRPRRRLAGYEILRTIGEGGMGTVFLAEKEVDGIRREFALKVLNTGGKDQQRYRDMLKRFLHEAKAISRITHPNVIRIVEYGVAEEEGIPYIVLEYIKGCSLKHHVEMKTEMSYETKTEILIQIARALGAIHEHEIYHRDIKPDNVLLDAELNVKLTDFGIASLPESELTLTNNLLGSPAYLSPEGFISAKVDYRADLFSFGILAYEFLLGARPFEGESFTVIASQVRNQLPKEPRKVDPDFPMVLQLVLGKMLKKDPIDRHANANEIADELAVFLKGGNDRLMGNLTQRVLHNDWV